MPKRRRERDRPKAAHDAPYNPNKRVMLSYASDDEVEDEPAQEVNPPIRPWQLDTTVGDATSVDGESDDESGSNSMAHRELFEQAWKEDDSNEVADEAEAANHNSLWSRQSKKDDVTGQWAALGNISYQRDEEGDDEDEALDSEDEEAMAYLRAVR